MNPNDPADVVLTLLATVGGVDTQAALEDLVTPTTLENWRRDLADPEKRAILQPLGVVMNPRWVSATVAHVVMPVLRPGQEKGFTVPPGGALLPSYVATVRLIDGQGWRVERIATDQVDLN